MKVPDQLKLIRVYEDRFKDTERRFWLMSPFDHHSQRVTRLCVVRAAVEQGGEARDRFVGPIQTVFSAIQLRDSVLKIIPCLLIALALEE